MENIDIFTTKADLYSKYRPGYSMEFIQHLYSNVGLTMDSCIADIGSGTGIFSKLLLEKGSTVYAVEPNAAMRAVAERELSRYSKFHSIDSTGEKTSLSSKSIDYITAVQSFHWLDEKLFKTECQRILKPNGKVIVVYNRKDKTAEINKQQAALIKEFYPEHNDIVSHWEIRERPVEKFFDHTFSFVEFENAIKNNLNQFVGRILSASFSKQDTHFISKIEELFHSFSNEGIIYIPNNTIAYIGSL